MLHTEGRVICLEGPSAVGKTTLAVALADTAGAGTVKEVTGAAPPGADPKTWFIVEHVEHWARARRLARSRPLVVLDGDPFKALWYDRVFSADPATAVASAAERYAAELASGALGLPDLWIALDATEDELRARREGDTSRTRRNFDRHLRLVEPLRRYFAELAAAAPGRVVRLGTTNRHALAGEVLAAVGRLPAEPVTAVALKRHMAGWLNTSQV